MELEHRTQYPGARRSETRNAETSRVAKLDISFLCFRGFAHASERLRSDRDFVKKMVRRSIDSNCVLLIVL